MAYHSKSKPKVKNMHSGKKKTRVAKKPAAKKPAAKKSVAKKTTGKKLTKAQEKLPAFLKNKIQGSMKA